MPALNLLVAAIRVVAVPFDLSDLARRSLYAVLGLLATAVAIIGVWLPGLPTTPFVLVAVWAFARSSERLAAWFQRIPILRGAIEMAERYQRERTLPLWVRIVAPTFATGSTILVHLTTGSLWLTAIVGAAALSSFVFVIITPTDRPH